MPSPESPQLSLTPNVLNPSSSASLPPPCSVLIQLREKVNKLPKTVPLANKAHILAPYSHASEELTKDIQNDADIWETWDSKLTVLLPPSIDDLKQLVVHGKYGLSRLVSFFEHLVQDCKVDEGLLESKVKWVMDGIDAYVCFPSSFSY